MIVARHALQIPGRQRRRRRPTLIERFAAFVRAHLRLLHGRRGR